MMKHLLLTALMSLCVLRTEAQFAKNVSNNPLDVALGDPYILYDTVRDTYFLYGTGGADNGFMAYSSADLRSWKNEGIVYSNQQENAWATKDFWAPEVYRHGNRYYMFYSAHWKENPMDELENYRIGIAAADHPLGPFIDLTGKPLFDPGYPIIDANVYFAEDGKAYLYYSRCCYKHPVASEIADWAKRAGLYPEIEESWVYGVELGADLTETIGEPVLLLRPPVRMDDRQSEWESRSVTSGEINRRWTEGSFLFKHGNLYYMMYSANHFMGENYAVGYATSAHPLGQFEKSAFNPILEKNTNRGGTVSGTGHNSVLTTKEGVRLCVYHARTDRTGDRRMVFLDALEIMEDGRLVVRGPTVSDAL